MIAYLLRATRDSSTSDIRSLFGDAAYLGQTKQTDITLVFSNLPLDEVKRRVASLPQLPDGQHRFDVACFGETVPV